MDLYHVWHAFSINGQGVGILDFVGYGVFAAVAQLCHSSMKVAIDSM